MGRSAERPARRLLLAVLAGALAGCSASAQDAMATATQAQALLDAGRLDEAQATIDKAVRQRDDISAIYVTQAHIALAANKRPVAYQAYSNALALEATNPEALLGVAQLGITTGHMREGERAADQILSLNPQQTEALVVKAIAELVRNNRDGAIAYADQALKIAPDHLGALILKSRALATGGQKAEALALMKGAVQRTGYTPEMTMSLAELYRVSGDPAAYLDMLWRLKTSAPTALDYRFDLVEALYKLGRRDDARGEIVEMLDAKFKAPGDIDRIIRLWRGYDTEALTPEQIAQVGTTASVEARLAIARYFLATDRAPVAIALLRPLATGWSNNIQALYARARGQAGESDAAAQIADAVLKRDPDNGDALLIRARRAIAQGNASAAVVDIQRVIGNYPDWDEGYLALADAYGALQRPVGVRRAFEQGLHARPQSHPLEVAYLAWLGGQGDRARAVEVARQFALDSPALPLAWRTYADTCARAAASSCRAESANGLAASRTRFGLDPAPGTPPPIALIGRIA